MRFGVGAGGEDDVLRFELGCVAPSACGEIDGVDAVFGGAGEPAVAGDHRDLVLLHQEVEALGVLVDDGGLALLHGGPVELRALPTSAMPYSAACFRWSQISALNSRALVGMQPTCRQVPPSTVAHLDERDFEAELAAANGRGVAGGAAADDGHVVDCLGLVSAKGTPFVRVSGRGSCHCSV